MVVSATQRHCFTMVMYVSIIWFTKFSCLEFRKTNIINRLTQTVSLRCTFMWDCQLILWHLKAWWTKVLSNMTRLFRAVCIKLFLFFFSFFFKRWTTALCKNHVQTAIHFVISAYDVRCETKIVLLLNNLCKQQNYQQWRTNTLLQFSCMRRTNGCTQATAQR